MKVILLQLSILNGVGILVIYICSILLGQNHYALPVDIIFLISSNCLFALNMMCLNRKALVLSIVSVVLGLSLNVFNIGIDRQTWIERAQPSLFQFTHYYY